MSRLETIAYMNEAIRSEAVPGSGPQECAVTLGPVPIGSIYEIERIVVYSTSVAGTQAAIYIGSGKGDSDELPENLISGTTSGRLDFADYDPPIRITGGQTLRVVWYSTPDVGSRGVARFQYKISRIVEDSGRPVVDPRVPLQIRGS